MSQLETTVLATKLLCDFEFFTRYFFQEMYGRRFDMAPHLHKVASSLIDVVSGKTKRLIINMPPRYGKTEMAVKMFVCWCLANNPKAKFIHISRSDGLVRDNSTACRSLMLNDTFRALFSSCWIKNDAKAKNRWYTVNNGGMYAVATGSQTQGFGAGIKGDREYTGTGSVCDGFGGAIIIDDPMKTMDAMSDITRETLNSRFNDTIASRVNNPDVTPIILIMQRLHDRDLAGFLLSGGSGEDWTLLKMPALQEDGTPLYPAMHSIEKLNEMKAADPMTFAGQYQQEPMVLGGNIFLREWFRFYDDATIPILFDNQFQSWDFTFKDTTSSDNVCGTVWGKKGANWYLLDCVCRKMSFIEQRNSMIAMCAKWPNTVAKYVEDKANGSAIIDSLKDKISGIIPVNPTESKVARAYAVTPVFQSGNVYLPKDAPWVSDYIDEMTKFDHAPHDDRVDSTTMAISQTMHKTSLWDL